MHRLCRVNLPRARLAVVSGQTVLLMRENAVLRLRAEEKAACVASERPGVRRILKFRQAVLREFQKLAPAKQHRLQVTDCA